MEKKLCSYEALFTVVATLPEDELRAVVDKFTSLINENATDVSVNEWGKRRLAYPIRYNNEGYTVLVSFKSEPSFPRELERQLRISDRVLRVLITRKQGNAVAAAPAAVAEAATEAAVAAAAETPAAETPAATDAE